MAGERELFAKALLALMDARAYLDALESQMKMSGDEEGANNISNGIDNLLDFTERLEQARIRKFLLPPQNTNDDEGQP